MASQRSFSARLYVTASVTHGPGGEAGSHEALMAAAGHYAELYEIQAAACR